jgi:hypothetical protein
VVASMIALPNMQFWAFIGREQNVNTRTFNTL